MHEADHVETVVLERGFKKSESAGAQEVEVCVWHQCAWQWIVALETKDPLLHVSQRAALESMPVQGSHQRQQVDVRGMCELAWHSCHDPACAQHRQIERPAVERSEPIGRLELLLQRMEKGGLHPGFRQEELRNAKPAVDRPCHGSRENVCAR